MRGGIRNFSILHFQYLDFCKTGKATDIFIASVHIERILQLSDAADFKEHAYSLP